MIFTHTRLRVSNCAFVPVVIKTHTQLWAYAESCAENHLDVDNIIDGDWAAAILTSNFPGSATAKQSCKLAGQQ